MQSADKYYFNYLAKFIADNRDNFVNIIDNRDKKNCTDNGNLNQSVLFGEADYCSEVPCCLVLYAMFSIHKSMSKLDSQRVYALVGVESD